MDPNPLLQIQHYGQSVWLDFIRRKMIFSGRLKRLIREDGLRGVTSNPSIFDEVISGSEDYDGAIAVLAREGKSVSEIYRALTVADVQAAADDFRDVYQSSDGEYGFVSLEVNPHLAYRTQETIEEARELWRALNRPNVFIKVPATPAGLPAIRQLISEGVNVNVTLLFGLPRYRKVADAYIAGLEQRAAAGRPLEGVCSVASFFLSRIDVLIDPKLEKMAKSSDDNAASAAKLRGRVAVASARQAYRIYRKLFDDGRFRKLAEKGARPQKVLWASTSTKNPDYPDVKYVEALIGPETINTLPMKTLDAYRDHGNPGPRLEEAGAESGQVLETLAELGIDLDQATRQLEEEGVEKFNQPYDSLMEGLSAKRKRFLQEAPDRWSFSWGVYGRSIQRRLDALERIDFTGRLWRRDPGLWSDEKADRRTIANALGWLHAPEKVAKALRDLCLFIREARQAGLRRVVHMGMGGSSLAPLVFQHCFTPTEAGMTLTVLDTTDPSAVAGIAEGAVAEDTLFIAASKSGTTTETIDFLEYFYERMKKIRGDRAGDNFVAITDPGTPLAATAVERRFRRLFVNWADVGGRYSALTWFGMVPAALMGLDVEELLSRAMIMRRACDSGVPALQNPGLMLGTVLGELALQGRNKVTFVLPEGLSTLGMWLEQLLAESTGKEGTGLLPVAGEALAAPGDYGNDRVFVHYRLEGQRDQDREERLADLRAAGHPVVTLRMSRREDLAREFYLWEIAVATIGVALGIDVFNQPNVQESKDNTGRILDEIVETGSLPDSSPDLKDGNISVWGSEGVSDLSAALRRLFGTAAAGNYAAVLAYLPENNVIDKTIAEVIRRPLQQRLKLATTVGYGPRYLHSTGQLHKGGPNGGLYLLLTADGAPDLMVPGRNYGFGRLRLAQAIGDFQALQQHGRRVLRIHMGDDAAEGLKHIGRSLKEILRGLP